MYLSYCPLAMYAHSTGQHRRWVNRHGDAIWRYTRNRNSQLERTGNEWLITTSMHESPQMSYSPKFQRHLCIYSTWKIVRALIHLPSDFIEDTPLDIKTLMASRSCLESSCLSSFGRVGDGAWGRESEVSGCWWDERIGNGLNIGSAQKMSKQTQWCSMRVH